MSQPQPVDPNRLMAMLGGAKRVMQKVETGDFSTGNVTLGQHDGTKLVEGSNQMAQPSQMVQPNQMAGENTTNVAPQMMGDIPIYKNMESSNMPAAIKEAMMKQPIAQVNYNPTGTFSLEDVPDLVEKPMPLSQPVATNQKPAPITESVKKNANDTFTVSEAALRGIIEDIVDKKFGKFMIENYNKKLTENAIKKTITTLINEGKLKTKRKVNS